MWIGVIIAVKLILNAAANEPQALIDLQRIVLAENPRIKAMDAEAQMMKKRIPQSTALEDPKLKLGINNLPVKNPSFTKEDMTSKEIGVSQMIPLGKLPFQDRIARREYDKAVARLRVERVESLHMVRLYYYELMYAGSSIKILEEIKKQIKLVIDSEVAATKAGMGSLSNVIKARIEHTMVDEEIINLKQRQKELEQDIWYLAGNTVPVAFMPLAEPDFMEVPIEQVRKEILASNPQLRLAALDVELSKSEIALKKSEYAPDLELGFSYMQRQDGKRKNSFETMLGMDGPTVTYKSEKVKRDDMVSAMATISIPFWFWQKNIPMVEEMKKKNESAKNLYRDALNKMYARAGVLESQMVKWRDLYRLYHDRLIPQTELALETNLARYRTGSVEFMPVIDTVRMLLRYRKELVMAVKEYYASYSEMNALMGAEVLR